jgi:cysteinyl-tRNA synthetase
MQITNTLSGTKEPLPRSKKKISLFVCGPTVYDELHIGNARIYIIFDTFVRFLRSQKIGVFYLQNITDIDDKIIARAREKGLTPKKLAAHFAKIFKKNMKDLHIISVDAYAPATKYIPEIIAQVERLIEKGHAYKIEGDGYYFDLGTFPDYGKLARRTMEHAEDGVSRIDENPEKRNRGDFCLWKFSKPDEPSWKAPFGDGRPGWHIEDTAISEKFFGPQYDIHGAGADLIFPHHEAEIAQQEAASGLKPFVKIWMHAGLLTVDGKKMSKSLGNFITIGSFLAEHGANTLRFIALGAHYRSPLDFTKTLAASAESSLSTVREFLAKMDFIKAANPHPERRVKIEPIIKNFASSFVAAMEDDFNTPAAIASIFEFMNELNPLLSSLTATDVSAARRAVLEKLGILGIRIAIPKIPRNIRKIAEERELFRTHKQFIDADRLRNEVTALGYTIEDTPFGPFILKIR